ncbi:hypothetical protein [Egicoccus sp. AB-alg2]|uniref:hypothetical protein n=1 Tax=Egicoccus sp. AB-alg2 TaxID=3242693 RepID=UPI00359EFCB6
MGSRWAWSAVLLLQSAGAGGPGRPPSRRRSLAGRTEVQRAAHWVAGLAVARARDGGTAEQDVHDLVEACGRDLDVLGYAVTLVATTADLEEITRQRALALLLRARDQVAHTRG